MVRLNSFRNNNKQRNIIIVESIFLIGLLIVGISYAVYQKADEVRFINAKVGKFETSNSDIELAMTLDGEDIDTPPNKSDGFYNIIVECDYATGEWDKERWAAIIGNITSNKVKCNVNFESYKKSIQGVEIGDYISMTPTSTSYTPLGSDTGCLNNSSCTQNTINPSELKLWRVIKKNDDGTVEVVSEYVSSVGVYFNGKAGYMNAVGSLNTIASQYTNEKYVERTRNIGYNNQIERCSSLSSCPSDNGYEIDKNLVQEALGTLGSNAIGGLIESYWISYRYAYFVDGYGPGYAVGFLDREKFESGINNRTLMYYYNDTQFVEAPTQFRIRPVLTLKSEINIINGDGKSADTAYQLS